MPNIGTRERYFLILAVFLVCVMILASAGLEILKHNENETGGVSLVDDPDNVSAESIDTASKGEGATEDPLNGSTEGGQRTVPLSETSTESMIDQEGDNINKATISISSLLEYLSPEDMSDRSDVIIIGTVKEILPGKWNTEDGERPTDDIYELGSHDILYTDVVITVDEYLKNPLPEKELIVRIQGGEDDLVIMDVEDQPSFKNGEKVFLYLKNDTLPYIMDYGPDHYVVTGVSQGKFTLTDDGEAISFGEHLILDDLLETI